MAQLTIPEVQQIQALIAPIRSKRGRIRRAVKELMATITKSRGYSIDVVEASYNVKGWESKAAPETPVIYIIGDTQQIVKHAGRIREYTWTLRLFGVVRERTIEELDEFLADIEESIDDNNSLFGEVNKVEVPEVSTDNQLFSEFDGTHLFEVVIDVEYTRAARAPR
jgi:hypothetical protein